MHVRYLVVALVACSHANKNPTPGGTKVLEWAAAQSTRPAFTTATFDDKQAVDRSESFLVTEKDHVKLKLHIETATAKYQEDGAAVQLPAVMALGATVEDGKDYTFGAAKCTGPNYNLGAPGQAPGITILDCSIQLTKPDTQAILFFQMQGDGTIMPSGKKIDAIKTQ